MDADKVMDYTAGLTDEECRENLARYEQAMDKMAQYGLVLVSRPIGFPPTPFVRHFSLYLPRQHREDVQSDLWVLLAEGEDDVTEVVRRGTQDTLEGLL